MMSIESMKPWNRLAMACALIATATAASFGAAQATTLQSERHAFRVVTLVEGLEYPWSLAFLPGGDLLVTERPGRLRLIQEGRLRAEPIAGLPDVFDEGQGGLLDIALHPNFADNRLIYLSYAAEGDGGSGTEIARARLVEGRLENLQVLLKLEPKTSGSRHFGSRLLFGPDGQLYATIGERADPERAQDLGDLAGKIVRLTPDGQIPSDNPFVGRDDARPEIFTLGHRNPQGLALQPESGRIWTVEHGPRGGDEANAIVAGANYGWPVVTYGKSYAGFSIGEGTEKAGMTQPATYWVPSISPSGLTFYQGTAFPGWHGDLFVGALSGQRLLRLEVEGDRVVQEERLLAELDQRIRDVRVGPDGLLYLLTDDSEGALLRLEPVP